MDKRKFRLAIFGIITAILWSVTLSADGYHPSSKYFFAKVDRSDSTIVIILDGSFYYQTMNLPSYFTKAQKKFGTPLESPTHQFFDFYMRYHFQHPDQFYLGEGDERGYFKLHYSDPYHLESTIGFKQDAQFLIIKPTPDGKGRRISTRVKEFYYYSEPPWHDPNYDPSSYTTSYLVAKTQNVGDISDIQSDYLVAIYQKGEDQDLSSEVIKSRKIPPNIQATFDLLTDLRNLQEEQIQSFFESKEEYESLLKYPMVKSTIQPVWIKTNDLSEYRYLITLFAGEKNPYSVTILLDQQGNSLPSPVDYHFGALFSCVGIVKSRSLVGIEDLVIYRKSTFDYTGGLSLLKYDDDGIFREILYLPTFSD